MSTKTNTSIEWTTLLTKERYETYLEDYLGNYIIPQSSENKYNTYMLDYDTDNPKHEKHLVSSVHKHFNEKLCEQQQDFSEVKFKELSNELWDSGTSYFPEGYLFECDGYNCIGWFYNEHRCQGCEAKKYVNTDYVEWEGFEDVNLDSVEPVGSAESM